MLLRLSLQHFTPAAATCQFLDKPWILEILGNRELQQDQQAPADHKKQNRNLQVRLHVSSKEDQLDESGGKVCNVQVGQQDRASHHFLGHPEGRNGAGQSVHSKIKRP